MVTDKAKQEIEARARELYDVYRDLLRKIDNKEIDHRQALDEMYVEGFRKIRQPLFDDDRVEK